MAAPLSRLLKKGTKWEWGPEQEKAFDELHYRLTEAPVLACPDWTKPFVLQTDASREGLGAVLTQETEEGERIIAYASRTLNKAEKNYSVTELECLAVKWGIWKMRDYLEGYHFTVLTDHQSLKWLDNIDNPSGRLARWALELSQWDYEIRYRRGSDNALADALSRQPLEACGVNAPLKCKWYSRTLERVREDPTANPEYCIRDGRLYRHILHSLNFNDNDPAEEWKLCVPIEERQRVMRETHDEPTAGHLGVAKTLARLSRDYYWPGMFKDGARYVRGCLNCQKHKADQQAPAGMMHASHVDQPWEAVSADLVGPLPRSNAGHTTLLVMQDRLTKWVELKPLRKATGHAITEAIRSNVILRHGCPKEIVTDNGKQFISHEFTQLLEDCGIKHKKTPPYTPQCNPVERVNRVIKTMISQYIKKSHKTWDQYLDEIKFAYNTATHTSTGYTPAYLNTGREFTPPGSLRHKAGGGSNAGLELRLKRVREALELARSSMARSFQKQQKYYDLRRRDWAPLVGDRVLKRQKSRPGKRKAR